MPAGSASFSKLLALLLKSFAGATGRVGLGGVTPRDGGLGGVTLSDSGVPSSYSSRMAFKSRRALRGANALSSDASSSFLSAFFIFQHLADLGDEFVIGERGGGLRVGFNHGARRGRGLADGDRARDGRLKDVILRKPLNDFRADGLIQVVARRV